MDLTGCVDHYIQIVANSKYNTISVEPERDTYWF